MAIATNDKVFRIKFGGGINSRADEADIDPAECADGENFDLDIDSNMFRRRGSVQRVATCPNGLAVRGLIQLVKSDGTRSVLVQAGGTIYEWDGTATGFTFVATCSPAARLRGPIEANSVKDNKVLIADLELVEKVKTWDGTTFEDLAHNLSGGVFYARYITVADERAYYANVRSSTDTPHLLVASARDAFGTLTTANRPSSSLGVGDPFFLPMPNLRPVNGLVAALGVIVLSTFEGEFYRLTGDSSQDFQLKMLSAATGSVGDEGMAFAGNDIIFSRHGAIESLAGTDKFGDVETDDLSRWILPSIRNVRSFFVGYSPRFHKVYCIPRNGGRIHVLHKSFVDQRAQKLATGEGILSQGGVPKLSPWTRWTTQHSFNFEPTAAMRMYRPGDGLEFMYLGGNDGSLYQLEGDSGADPDSTAIIAERRSGILELPPGVSFDVSGWVRYRQLFASTLTLTLEWGGINLFDRSIDVALAAASNAPVWGGGSYFGGAYFGGSFDGGRLARKPLSIPGSGEHFQVLASVTGSSDFGIEEIGLAFKAAA